MKFVLLSLVLACTNFAFASSKSEQNLAAKAAVRELEIASQISAKESKLSHSNGSRFLDTVLNASDRRDWCNDNGQGSALCWQKCSQEGFGSQTCASRCGVTTSAGSEACWSQCSHEGFGSQTCSSRCGVSTSGGSKACWDQCSQEGFGSQTCADRCGTN